MDGSGGKRVPLEELFQDVTIDRGSLDELFGLPRSGRNQYGETSSYGRGVSLMSDSPVQNGRYQPSHVQGNVQHGAPTSQPSLRTSAGPLRMDPNIFGRGGHVATPHQQQLYRGQPWRSPNLNVHRGRPAFQMPEFREKQSQYLQRVANVEVGPAYMSQAEHDEKEAFRAALERVIRNVCAANPQRFPAVNLQSFGSFMSGFASAGSDMDLLIMPQDGAPHTPSFTMLEGDLPRVLEKRLLELGVGARLLSNARVPIIKVCEKPDDGLLERLRQERKTWDALPDEKKYPHLHRGSDDTSSARGSIDMPEDAMVGASATETFATRSPPAHPRTSSRDEKRGTGTGNGNPRPMGRRDDKSFTRERKAGPLDFPKRGVGIQCDINFFNPLGLHNTQMLRCYSLCDPRVRPMIVFVKAWAKRRKINSSYSGTLSSYGYVLMVLHYLVNVARPWVLPNLQDSWRPDAQCTPHGATRTYVDGWTVDFWRNEAEIIRAAQNGQLSSNRESLGSLLNGFFKYYSSQDGDPQFRWTTEVLSLRTPGGLLKKDEKGWTRSISEERDGRRVQNRHLLCIEDPFEHSHNVARTVIHSGIVAIRDEFRRTHRILRDVGFGRPPADGELFTALIEAAGSQQAADSQQAAAPAQLERAMGDLHMNTKGQSVPPAQHAAKPPPHSESTGRPPSAVTQPAQSKGPQRAPVLPKALSDAQKEPHPGPSATAAKPKPKSTPKQSPTPSRTPTPKSRARTHAREGIISGERAKAHLESLQKKKGETPAQPTTAGAAATVRGVSHVK